MRYILDTNILLFLARDKENGQAIYQKFDLGNTQNQVYFSIVSYSELYCTLLVTCNLLVNDFYDLYDE